MPTDYVAKAIRERLKTLWILLLLRRLRRALEKQYEGQEVPALWRPFFSVELPPYRLSTGERAEEQQLLQELFDRSGEANTWGDEEDFVDQHATDLKRFRRKLQSELELDESAELYDYLWTLQPQAEKTRIISQLKRVRFRSISGGKPHKSPGS